MKIRLGTRGSALALWQAEKVSDEIKKINPGCEVEIIKIKTEGDRILDRSLAAVGGKGLFVKDIEQALLDGGIDIAVHSLKDVPAEFPEGLGLTAYLEREDPRDALISSNGETLEGLPEGAVLGTSSLRRKVQILNKRPDLEIKDIRGNVQTRMKKVEDGEYHATILAVAGMKRLGIIDRASERIPESVCLPAVGQAIVAVESRLTDDRINAILSGIGCLVSEKAAVAERTFLKVLEGGCHAPIAAHAVVSADGIYFRGFVSDPEGRKILQGELRKNVSPIEIGQELAEAFLSKGAKEILNG